MTDTELAADHDSTGNQAGAELAQKLSAWPGLLNRVDKSWYLSLIHI